MPLGCFGPSSGEKQLQVELDRTTAQLSSKERELADLKRRNDEAFARQAQAQRAAAEDFDRNANLLRRQVEELKTALQVEELKAAQASDKLIAALIDVVDTKRQLEEERAASRSAEQARETAATAQAQVVDYEKQIRDIQAHLEALSQELAVARKEAAAASGDATFAREDAASAREQLVKALADQSKAIAEAEERAAAVAQEAAASTVAAAAELAEKASISNRQQVEVLKAQLAAQQARLETASQAEAEVSALREQLQDLQQQLAAVHTELSSAKELRHDLSERLKECQAELEDANLIRQSLEAERQVLAEQLEQLTTDRVRLEAQVQDLEANLLDAVTTSAMTASAVPAAEATAAITAAQDDGVAGAVSPSAGGSSEEGENDLARLGTKALVAQLLETQEDVHDLRKELERTIVGHVAEEEALQTEIKGLKGQVEATKAALTAAEIRVRELEVAQDLKDQLGVQLGNTEHALEEARSSVEALRQEIMSLELDRAALRSREDETQAEIAKLQRQLKEAQMRAVELVSANADLQVEQAKLRSEVLSQGLLSDSNTQMAAKLLSDYQALKHEHAKLLAEVRRKDETMALLQEQLSSLTEIGLDSMVRQIDHVQTRKPAKKSMAAAAPVEAMLAAAGLAGKFTAVVPHSSSGGGSAGTPPAEMSTAVSTNGTATPTAAIAGPDIGLVDI
ncbi:hypothetical protein Vretimale_4083 [Volvox reticuliferus]|uniref:Uncharacterized protein n=1 Tax=Volvox reticuliferus TaxID=1737510 RepID=A0A8J4DB23_9CHLO|nr:hypothetical protein Vretifemale_1650 [Volvox reticuliferus]GIL98709.1 hypothetical protein Vretimale_4083 [Volvox reticuliferus]